MSCLVKRATNAPPCEPETRYVDARYLGKKYGVSGRHILMLAASKHIPSFRVGRKCVRFDEEAVAAVLERVSQ